MKEPIMLHLLVGGFFVAVFIEVPLILAYGMCYLWNYAIDPDLGVEWVLIWYMLIFMLEVLLLILSSIRTTGRMSTKL
jgi:hypothetical protein